MDGNHKLYDLVARSEEAGLVCADESLTVQSEKDDADINVIVGRYGIGATMPPDIDPRLYADFDEVVDYTSAVLQIQRAGEEFMRLPGGVRAEFDNDPQKFLDFAVDSANIERMVSMGLAFKREVKNGPGTDVANASASTKGGAAGDGGAAEGGNSVA